MPNPVPARYRAADGVVHEVITERLPSGRWRVLDVVARGRELIEELTGYDDRQAQAEALARDYAAHQQARHDQRRDHAQHGGASDPNTCP